MESEEIRQSRLSDLRTRRDEIINLIEKSERAADLLQEIIYGYNQKISEIDEEMRNLTPKTCYGCYHCNPFGDKYLCKSKDMETHVSDAACEQYQPLPF